MTPASFIVPIISYVAGLLTGIAAERFIHSRGMSDSQKQDGNIVLLVVTIVWAASMLVDIISPDYETSPLVHGLMGAIVGFFYRPQKKE